MERSSISAPESVDPTQSKLAVTVVGLPDAELSAKRARIEPMLVPSTSADISGSFHRARLLFAILHESIVVFFFSQFIGTANDIFIYSATFQTSHVTITYRFRFRAGFLSIFGSCLQNWVNTQCLFLCWKKLKSSTHPILIIVKNFKIFTILSKSNKMEQNIGLEPQHSLIGSIPWRLTKNSAFWLSYNKLGWTWRGFLFDWTYY